MRAPAGTGLRKTPEPTTGSFRLLSELQLHLAQTIHDHNQEPSSPLLNSGKDIGTAFLHQATDQFLERVVALYCLQDLLDQHPPIQEMGSLSAASGPSGYELQESLLQYCSYLYRRSGASLFSLGHLCDTVRIPNGAIAEVLNALGEVSWSAGGTDVLGRIHSLLLGRRLTVQAGSVHIEDDPFARKSGGVYYTPDHIVRYMVDRTLGRWLYGTDNGRPDGELINYTRPKSISDVAGDSQRGGLRVLDPAMGSGVLLRYAFEVLSDFYAQADATGTRREHFTRILREHLYGVDVDAGAVALAEINLLLSVLTHTTGKRGLSDCAPIATANLRVGNSLISGSTIEQRRSAFASQHQQLASSARDQALTRSATRALAAKKNQMDSALNSSLQSCSECSENWQPFNWEIEFPEVFDPDLPDGERGFTVVVGNPPYLFGEHIPADEKPYLESQYEMARGQYDLYWLFYERSIDLLKEGGLHGFVVPDALTVRDEVRRVREMLVNRGQLKDIARVGAAFPAPEVSTVVTVWQKSKERSASVNIDLIDSAGLSSVDRIKVQTLAAPPSYRFSILVPNELQAIFARMMGRSNPLSDHVSISRGEELGKRELHRLDAEISKGHLPILVGKDVGSFEPCRARHSIEEDRIRKNRSLYGQTKIVVVKTGYKLKATLDTSGFCTLQSLYNLIPRQSNIDLRPLLAIMLSTPVQEYLWRTFTGYKSVFPQINQSQLGQLPIPWLDINSADPVPVHEALIRLSQRMLDLSETRLAVLTAVAGVLGTGSDTSSSLRSYIDQLDGLIDFQPLLDSSLEGQVDGVTVDERADSILVRVRIGPSDDATLDMGRIGSGDEWHDAAKLTAVDRELHLYILVALKGYLAEKHRKRVWSRGKVLDGVLQAVKIPQPPAAAVPELLAGLRLALPADLHHHSAGLDEDGAPLHLTSIEDDLRATRSEIDRYVYSLFGLGTDEQALLDTFRYAKI